MLTVKPEKNPNAVKDLFLQKNIPYTAHAMAVLAKEGEEQVGCCLFTVNGGIATILDLEPQEDFFLADGILRSALHVALCNGVTDAFYDNLALEPFLLKDRFIKNQEIKQLEIEKLFSSCCNCEKND